MKKKLQLVIGGFFILSSSVEVNAQTTNFNYTGNEQYYIVPPCVTQLEITAKGAQGGNSILGGSGGLGGTVYGVLNVVPGDSILIYVGGQNGYNGGGLGGQNGNAIFGGPAGILAPSGGGATDIRIGGNQIIDRVIVAGGGGGAGENGVWPGCQPAGPSGNGGNGGGLIATNGTFGVGTPCNCLGGGGDGGFGGTQTNGGIAGGYAGSTSCLIGNWAIGEAGSLGFGGNGSLVYYNGTGAGGGGGGGFYGGALTLPLAVVVVVVHLMLEHFYHLQILQEVILVMGL